MKELLKSLSEAKKEIGKISKDSTNPFFKSKYFDINRLLETIEPILFKHGLLVLQPVKSNKVYSEIYHIESGDVFQSYIELPNLNDPQKLGSAITYYRRYTLQSLLSLQSEDDDANKASKQLPELKDKSDIFNKVVSALQEGKATIEQVKTKFYLTSNMEAILSTYIN